MRTTAGRVAPSTGWTNRTVPSRSLRRNRTAPRSRSNIRRGTRGSGAVNNSAANASIGLKNLLTRQGVRIMKAKIHQASQLVRLGVGVYLLVLLLAGATNLFAHDEWFRRLDLEPSLGEASLVMVGRVVDVSETKIMMGGKVESALLQ